MHPPSVGCVVSPCGSKKAGIMTPTDFVMVSSYEYRRAAFSTVIAVFASCAAREFAGEVTSARGGVHSRSLSGGAMRIGVRFKLLAGARYRRHA